MDCERMTEVVNPGALVFAFVGYPALPKYLFEEVYGVVAVNGLPIPDTNRWRSGLQIPSTGIMSRYFKYCDNTTFNSGFMGIILSLPFLVFVKKIKSD